MDTEQLTLFGNEDIVGTGLPHPWPATEAETDDEPEMVADPGQLTLGDTDIEDAA